MTGTSIASSSPAHASRAHSQTTPGHFNAEATGAFKSGYTGVVPQQDPAKAANFAAAPTGLPEFPAITTFLATKYGDSYKNASKDSTGSVAGQEVLRLLASVPVDVSVKKSAWDLVAGIFPCSNCLCRVEPYLHDIPTCVSVTRRWLHCVPHCFKDMWYDHGAQTSLH